MKQKLFALIVLIAVLLSGCSNKKSLYQTGVNELENGNYEKAIECFVEYQKTYSDNAPLQDAYYQYAVFLCNEEDYINALYYYRLSNKTSDNVTDLIDKIYENGLRFLENDEELLAFQYLSYIKDDIDIESNIIPESPLAGIWKLDNNYIKLTKTSLSYMSAKQSPTFSDFSEEYLLILGDFYINDESNIEIDDHYLTHHNEHYVKYIRIIDNDTIFIEGSNTLTGEYKRIN